MPPSVKTNTKWHKTTTKCRIFETKMPLGVPFFHLCAMNERKILWGTENCLIVTSLEHLKEKVPSFDIFEYSDL